MSGYTKLFSSIIASTVWREPDHVRVVWITMLALANKNGVVEASVPGLADMARVSLEQCQAALAALSAPDPYSRTKDHEGRRIADVEGGFLLLNHAKYRDQCSAEDRREYRNEWDRLHRPDRPNHKRRLPPTAPDSPRQNSTGPTHTTPDPTPTPDPDPKTCTPSAEECEFPEEVRLWNSQEKLKKVLRLTPKRVKALESRRKDSFFVQNFPAVISRIAGSQFLTGGGANGFVATFDWILKPDNFVKVVEGNYENRANGKLNPRNSGIGIDAAEQGRLMAEKAKRMQTP